MRTLRPEFVLAVGVVAVLVAAPAHAVSNRIFLSTNGNNASDCANPLTPCLTFAGALAQVNPGGEVIAESTGGYGPLNITQAVTISGPPGVVIYSGLSVSVNAPAATVVQRGLTIDGTGATGNAINVTSVGSLFVENCVITGFVGSGSSAGNALFFGSSGNLFVKDTTIRGNANAAIWVDPPSGTTSASIDHCRLEGNGLGVAADSGASVGVRDSVISGSTETGILGEHSGEISIDNCLLMNNLGAIHSATFATVRLSNSTVIDNGTALTADLGCLLLTRGNNTVQGNTTKGSFTGPYPAD